MAILWWRRTILVSILYHVQEVSRSSIFLRRITTYTAWMDGGRRVSRGWWLWLVRSLSLIVRALCWKWQSYLNVLPCPKSSMSLPRRGSTTRVCWKSFWRFRPRFWRFRPRFWRFSKLFSWGRENGCTFASSFKMEVGTGHPYQGLGRWIRQNERPPHCYLLCWSLFSFI
jgi:hypothetical protein